MDKQETVNFVPAIISNKFSTFAFVVINYKNE